MCRCNILAWFVSLAETKLGVDCKFHIQSSISQFVLVKFTNPSFFKRVIRTISSDNNLQYFRGNQVKIPSLITDLSASQWHFVTLTTDKRKNILLLFNIVKLLFYSRQLIVGAQSEKLRVKNETFAVCSFFVGGESFRESKQISLWWDEFLKFATVI